MTLLLKRVDICGTDLTIAKTICFHEGRLAIELGDSLTSYEVRLRTMQLMLNLEWRKFFFKEYVGKLMCESFKAGLRKMQGTLKRTSHGSME